ncbi:MAG: energy-coupling factor transporter transmembrane protein EcfT [Clostridia bacterium]|nr:energy-coupling factor transporter transmembrane protein EcfT [Clostridia bacterium]
MKTLQAYNPAVAFFYLIICALLPVFSVNPVILCVSLFLSVSFYLLTVKNGSRHFHLFSAAVFAAVTVVNPIFSHNGRPVLFVMNDNPVTLEALLYGAAMGAALVSAIYWFAAFSKIMTSDKIMYIFARVSPKAALLISMTLRFIPMFKKTAQQTSDAQKATGLYNDTDSAANLKSRLQVYSSVVTRALETGIVTADSMEARGYSSGKRTGFAIYRFDMRDGIFSAVALLLFIFFVLGSAFSNSEFIYYPDISQIPHDAFSLVCYISYFIMAALPSALELGDIFKWKFLISKI